MNLMPIKRIYTAVLATLFMSIFTLNIEAASRNTNPAYAADIENWTMPTTGGAGAGASAHRMDDDISATSSSGTRSATETGAAAGAGAGGASSGSSSASSATAKSIASLFINPAACPSLRTFLDTKTKAALAQTCKSAPRLTYIDLPDGMRTETFMKGFTKNPKAFDGMRTIRMSIPDRTRGAEGRGRPQNLWRGILQVVASIRMRPQARPVVEHHNIISPQLASALGTLTSLEELTLTTESKTMQDYSYVLALSNLLAGGGLRNLRKFKCDYPYEPRLLIEAIADHLPRLEEISLPISTEDEKEAEAPVRVLMSKIAARKLENLRVLSLDWNHIDPTTNHILADAITSGKMRHLLSLSLIQCSIDNHKALRLATAMESGNLPVLQELSLRDNSSLSHVGVQAFANIITAGKLPNLTSFTVFGSELTNDTANAFAVSIASGKWPKLDTLHLAYGIDTIGQKAITDAIASAGLTMKELRLDFSPMTR